MIVLVNLSKKNLAVRQKKTTCKYTYLRDFQK